jgi:hypothetical protein
MHQGGSGARARDDLESRIHDARLDRLACQPVHEHLTGQSADLLAGDTDRGERRKRGRS